MRVRKGGRKHGIKDRNKVEPKSPFTQADTQNEKYSIKLMQN